MKFPAPSGFLSPFGCKRAGGRLWLAPQTAPALLGFSLVGHLPALSYVRGTSTYTLHVHDVTAQKKDADYTTEHCASRDLITSNEKLQVEINRMVLRCGGDSKVWVKLHNQRNG